MKFFYTIDKNAVLCIWKFTTDYLSEQYKQYKNYQNFKSGKRIKLNDKNSKIQFEEG